MRVASNLTRQRGAAEARRSTSISPSLPALLNTIDGRVTTPRNLTLHTAGATVVSASPGFFTRFLSTLIDPNIVSLLFLAGLLGLGFELFHPGVVIPGAFGAICMVCALFGFSVLPLSWAGLMLVLLGAALLVVDVHVVTHGALTLSGLVAMAFGFVIALPQCSRALPRERCGRLHGDCDPGRLLGYCRRQVDGRPTPARDRRDHKRSSAWRASCEPDGQVFVHGELWRARAAEQLEPGDRVAVDALDGLTLQVHRITT